MKKAQNESVILARHLNAFLNAYVPSQKSRSSQTLKSYRDALALYIGFLETEKEIRTESLCGACFSRTMIEEWLQWLMTQRGCSPETCNNRLASLRAFLKYLGMKDVSLLHLSEDATSGLCDFLTTSLGDQPAPAKTWLNSAAIFEEIGRGPVSP